MKYVLWGGAIILGLVALLCIVGWILPKGYHVERSVTINAPAAAIHPTINRLREWPTWTAWTIEKYPDMKIAFSGPDAGPGAKYEWDGESTGQGELTILTSDPAEGITYTMAFDHGAMPSTGGLRYAPAAAGTQVTWFADGDLGWNPISRYFGLALDGMMGPDFEMGLKNLKEKIESASELPAIQKPEAPAKQSGLLGWRFRLVCAIPPAASEG